MDRNIYYQKNIELLKKAMVLRMIKTSVLFLVGSVLLICLVVCCVFGGIRVAHLFSGVFCFW
jgi:hypothetical protein